MSDTDLRRPAVWGARALTYFIYAWVVVNEIILILGFTLKLFGANPAAGFTEWAYRNLERVMEPFRGMFPVVQLTSGTDVKPVIDTSILFAMLVYAIVAMALHALIRWLSFRLTMIDQRHEKEQAEAKRAEQEALRAQQVAALAAAANTTAQGAAAPLGTSAPQGSLASLATAPAPSAVATDNIGSLGTPPTPPITPGSAPGQ